MNTSLLHMTATMIGHLEKIPTADIVGFLEHCAVEGGEAELKQTRDHWVNVSAGMYSLIDAAGRLAEVEEFRNGDKPSERWKVEHNGELRFIKEVAR